MLNYNKFQRTLPNIMEFNVEILDEVIMMKLFQRKKNFHQINIYEVYYKMEFLWISVKILNYYIYVSSCERYFSKLRLKKLRVKINWHIAIILIKHEYINISCGIVIDKFAEGSKNCSVIIYYCDRSMTSCECFSLSFEKYINVIKTG